VNKPEKVEPGLKSLLCPDPEPGEYTNHHDHQVLDHINSEVRAGGGTRILGARWTWNLNNVK
jgi:hypothetical protein